MKAGRRDGTVRVALVGIGNCASALVQGVTFYQDAPEGEDVPGLMHVNLGGYHVRDIEFSAAFDVDRSKVGTDLSEAIFAEPNNTFRFTEVPDLNVPVHRGKTGDGIGKYLQDKVVEAPGADADVVNILRETETDIVVSFLPVGSERASHWYVEQALEANCGFVNCIPVFVASQRAWQRRFEERGLPIIGDDIKSQVGATITHRMLTNLFRERGVRLDRTYQLNFGGNTDFLNMLERERLDSKKTSKTNAVTSQLRHPMREDDVHVGPSDYVPWLRDQKWCYIHMEGTTFGNVPIRCEVKLEVWDSPNSAGVVIDAVRCAKLALDRGIGGALSAASSYFMKSPPQQYDDHEARRLTEEFIHGHGDGSAVARRPKKWPSRASKVSGFARAPENGRPVADDGRSLAQNPRPVAENPRQTAENGRPAAENGRPAAENPRQAAENGRQAAESGRQATDNARPVADNGRPASTRESPGCTERC